MKESPIINKVANSSLVTLNLEDYYLPGDRVLYDLKSNLYQGMILRERDFREFISTFDWSQYKDKFVAIHCSSDAIVPTWAYMLLATKISLYSKKTVFGDLVALETSLFQEAISTIDPEQYRDRKVVIKGCSKLYVPEYAYVEIVNRLLPVASSIMYGEPCSTVPLYKKGRK